MKLLIGFLLICSAAIGQIPSTNLTGHWQASVNGIQVIGSDTVIICGVDTIDVNGIDFSITAGYIPFKTGAVLRMRASGNQVDTAFWNRDVYPTTVFSCVDYNNQTFFKTASHTLNADSTELLPARITELAIYSAHKTGADSVSLYSYFGVPAISGYWVNYNGASGVTGAGNDATGTGTRAKPYKTIVKAITTVPPGSTINILSGINRATNVFDITDTTMVLNALGGAYIYAGNTSIMGRIATTATNNTLNRLVMVISGSQAQTMSWASTVAHITFNNCVFIAKTVPDIKNQSSSHTAAHVTLNQCVLSSTADLYSIADVNECFLRGVGYIFRNGNSRFNYNYQFGQSITAAQLSTVGGTEAKFNTFDTRFKAITLANTSTRGTILRIKGNVFNYTHQNINGSTDHPVIYCNTTNVTPVISHNTFTASHTGYPLEETSFIEMTFTRNPEIEYNTFVSHANRNVQDLWIEATDSLVGVAKFNYNYVYNQITAGVAVAYGGETSKANKFDGSQVIGNKFVGSLLTIPDSGYSAHFCLLNAGINFDVKYNYTSYSGLGMVIKSGNEGTYTANGIRYNVFKNNYVSLWVRGVKNLDISNCVFYFDNDTITPTNRLKIDENAALAGNQFSEDDTISNCIFYMETATPNVAAIKFDEHATLNGCFVQNSIVYNTSTNNYALVTDATSMSNQAAIDSGYFGSTVTTNPAFKSTTQLWPTKAFYGTDLGTAYDDGLDIRTTWPDGVATKQQGTRWLMGAYVYPLSGVQKSGGNTISISKKAGGMTVNADRSINASGQTKSAFP